MKYLSLFSGIGGFELGIQYAYEELCNANRGEIRGSQEDKERNKEQGLLTKKGEDISSKKRPVSECAPNISHQRPLCIGYSEIDKYAIQIYKKHFNHKNYGNITTISTNELPDFDLLVGGFPCQSFSIAGKRGGFDDTRGTLFFEIARILRDKRPRYFLLENVKGLLSHDSGKTFQTIIGVLSDLGYDIEWQVLNSKNHGVPQNRERIFFIGYLGGGSRPKVFPIGESGGEYNEKNGKGDDIAYCLQAGGDKHRGSYINQLARDYKDPKCVMQIKKVSEGKHQQDIVYHESGIMASLPAGTHGSTPHLTKTQMFDGKIRRLTPVECERLQGFPDGWTEGVSDTQRYKTLGNAVTVNVIKAIMLKLYENMYQV